MARGRSHSEGCNEKQKAVNNRGFSTTSVVLAKEVTIATVENDNSTTEVVERQDLQQQVEEIVDTSDRLIKLQVEFECSKIQSSKALHSLKLSSNTEYSLIQLAKRNSTFCDTGVTSYTELTTAYLTLERMGFSLDQVHEILSKTKGSISRCLDWAVINIDPECLPLSLTDKREHKQSKTEAVTFIPKRERPIPNTSAPIIEPIPISIPSTLIKTKEKTSEIMKDWILSSVQQDDDDTPHSTNLQYALLKHTLKANPENSDQMALLKMERDFNPRFVNEELAKLAREDEFVAGSRKKERRIKQAEEQADEGSDDLFGALFEDGGEPSPPSVPKTTTAIKDMSYSKWTGKSPKQYLMDYLSKNAKGSKAKFTPVVDNLPGVRFRIKIAGGPFDKRIIEMEEYERVENAEQAQHYVATKFLWDIIPHLPTYRSLPGPFRSLWLGFVEVGEKVVEESKTAVDAARQKFIACLENPTKVLAVSSLLDAELSNTPMQTNQSFTQNMALFSTIAETYKKHLKTQASLKMLSQRATLPIYTHKPQILTAIAAHPTLLISSETGSGKSTQVPHFIFSEACELGVECMVICTQPRRISAISLSERVGEEVGVPGLVGYMVRGENSVGKATRIVYMTTGVLLRMLRDSTEGVRGVTHIIVDEVHERSVDSDFLCLLVRKMRNVKIVLMSATADSNKFLSYFDNCAFVKVPGRTFGVEAKFLEDAIRDTGFIVEDGSEFALKRKMTNQKFAVSDGKGGKKTANVEWEARDGNTTIDRMDLSRVNLDLCEDLARYLHKNATQDTGEEKGSILVFLPGFGEIKQLFDRLSFDATRTGVKVIPLHSALGSGSQRDVFLPPPMGLRKIVLATNIAETGITIPDVSYVVDTCRANQISYDTHKHISRLSQTFISKASCLQRRGRAGRVREGICYHLIPADQFETLQAHTVPEIMRVPLEELILSAASTVGNNVHAILSEALDSPPLKHVERSMKELERVGALVNDGPRQYLTTLGTVLVNFPVDVRLGKMLLYSVALECLDTCLTIAASLSLGKVPFSRPFGSEGEADRARDTFKCGGSDLITIHNAYCKWREVCLEGRLDDRKYCSEKFMSRVNLGLIEDTRAQLLRLLVSTKSVGRDVYAKRNEGVIETRISSTYTRNDNKTCAVLAAITAGLYPNILRVVPDTTVDRPLGLILESPGSAGFVHPHKESAFSDAAAGKNTWFVYHMLSRVEGFGKSKLRVWDLTRVSSMFAFMISKSVLIDHRAGLVSLDDGVTMSCPARSAVALDFFRRNIQTLLEKGICGNVFSRSEAALIQLFFDLLVEDMGREKDSLAG